MIATIGTHNPLTYRGYVYDHETELYYLQSRYYNPERGRFLNADALASTGQGILGNNMFAYCNSNPVSRLDSNGEAFETVFDIASLILSAVEVAANPTDLGAWLGLMGDTVDLIPFVTGVGETIDVLRAAGKISDGADTLIDTYRNLKKTENAVGNQVHHILEKRFLDQIGSDFNPNEVMSVILDKDTHQAITNAFRNAARYGEIHNLDTIVRAGASAYRNDSTLMGAFLYTLEMALK